MNNLEDLHLQGEVLPLFDFTNNKFSKEALTDLFNNRPVSIEEIYNRQNILKGFIENRKIINSFSYSIADFQEVYQFIRKFTTEVIKKNGQVGLFLKYFLSSKKRERIELNFKRLVYLFNRLEVLYFSKIVTDIFPKEFNEKLAHLQSFLSSYKPGHYENMIRNDTFTIKHIVELNKHTSGKIETGQFAIFWENLFLVEAYISIAKGIIKNNFTFANFSTHFEIVDFYHPLLKQPVKNSLATNKNIVVLTGPNMSGKSTVLKAIGICVYLAHIGIGIPALSCNIPFFDSISVAINLQDDLRSGYSHFTKEIKLLKDILVEAKSSKRCFAIFDELFRSTSVEDALQISIKTLNGIKQFNNSYFFISTHLHELKEAIINENNCLFYYLDCEMNHNQPKFTYKLITGWSDLKIGQILFKQEGLDDLLS